MFECPNLKISKTRTRINAQLKDVVDRVRLSSYLMYLNIIITIVRYV